MLDGTDPSCVRTLPGSCRTCRAALAIRNSSSTDDRREERQAPQAAGQLRGRQRLEPQLAPALGRHAPFGQRPRRGFEHVPVLHVPMREHMLDVVGEAPHLLLAHDVDRRRRGDRIVVVDELQERFLDVPRTRLEDRRCRGAPARRAACLRARAGPACGAAPRGCCRDTPTRPTRPRESPCSSVHRAASMSTGG